MAIIVLNYGALYKQLHILWYGRYHTINIQNRLCVNESANRQQLSYWWKKKTMEWREHGCCHERGTDKRMMIKNFTMYHLKL